MLPLALPRAVPALALAALPCLALAQAATGAVGVAVRDGAGRAVPGAAVEVQGAGRTLRGTADEQGRLSFFHLRGGRYRVRVSGPAFADVIKWIEVLPGHHHRVTLALAPAPPERPPAPRPAGSSMDGGTYFSAEDLRATPRPADPWSVLRDAPGVLVDRANVGGSETALQSLVVSRGDGGAGAAWTLDGVDVTDPAALGSSSLFPDMDALSGVLVRSGALDVRVRTPGVQVGLFLREPGDRPAGSAHLRRGFDALQSDNLPTALRDRPFFRNRTRRVWEGGAEAGGRPRGGRLWLWGAAARNALRQDTLTEHSEELTTTSITGKARLDLGAGMLSLLALRSDKVHQDRDTGFSAAPEARWRQSGAAHLIAVEDQRRLGSLSLLSRLSYLDAGFTLEPQGGTAADALEDFQGVFRGSYLRVETERPRWQAGLEAAGTRHWLGLHHDLLAGAGYRRSRVATRQAWPGRQVLAFERQSVFFRAFRLTGFALPTRAQDARSVQDHLELYLQDTARTGRLTAALGLRLDRLGGRSLASQVEANPLFPTLLPAVRYEGGSDRVGWIDLVPRVGLAWDLTSDGAWVARGGYAAYGPSLGAGEVTFDNPIGREPASITYYWLDRNRDHAVQADELDRLRGALGSAGVDPDDPSSTLSPHVVDPDLRAPRTHELSASLETVGEALGGGVRVAWRRNLRPLWRPLRNLTLADYVATGAVRGSLFDREYEVVYFAPLSQSRIVPGNGRLLANREGYSQQAWSVELTAGGRLGRRVDWRAWAALMDWREFFDERERSVQDPTPLDSEPLQDAGVVAVRPGGLGRGDVFVNARWAGGTTLHARLPWRLAAALNAHARDGFPIPYLQEAGTGDPTAGAKSVLISPHLDSFRLPALVLLDARLEREIPLGRGAATLGLEVFNLLNRSTTLQVARDIELPAFGRPREILRPRIVRVGVRYRF